MRAANRIKFQMRAKTMSISSGFTKVRTGLSVMEVLFAIGVLTVGLLGVASILPVATKNASNTLDRDRAVEEVNNRAAADLAKIGARLDRITVANNSVTSFQATNARFVDIALANLPNEFCIDPWFLYASDNLRDDRAPTPNNNRNGYDRTVFPCYDPGLDPITVSPTAPLSASATSGWNLPRMRRVAIPFSGSAGIPSFASAEQGARNSDELNVIESLDSTKPPGLMVKGTNPRGGTGPNASLTTATSKGKYSSIAMMRRIAPGSNLFDASVVTLRNREVVTVPSAIPLPPSFAPNKVYPNIGTTHPAFNLLPYTAAAPEQINPPETQHVYRGETLGFVTYAPSPFVGGGGGEFTYRQSAFTNPEISAGDWVMLMRQEYFVSPLYVQNNATQNPTMQNPTPPPRYPPPIAGAANRGPLKFAWFRVTNVSSGPTLDDINNPTFYETTITVRGPDWIFHPAQVYDPQLGYAPPYASIDHTGTPYPHDLNVADPSINYPGRPAYDLSVIGHGNLGTAIVLMPDVVSVQSTQIQL